MAALRLSVILLALALSGAAASAANGVRLSVRPRVDHPGDRVQVTVVNPTAQRVTFSPCPLLARRVGGSWKAITRSDGPRVVCRARSESVPAHGRRTLALALFDDLTAGRLRVSLIYSVGRRSGTVSTSIVVTTTCVFPKGARQLARAGGTEVASLDVPTLELSDDHVTRVLGCDATTGRVHVLATTGLQSEDSDYQVQSAIAGSDAAVGVQYHDLHYGAASVTIAVFDLKTGRGVRDRGGQLVRCGIYEFCNATLRGVAVNAAGDAAALTAINAVCQPPSSTCSSQQEQAVVSDGAGVRAVDSVLEPIGAPWSLSDLAIDDSLLTWNHSGIRRSAAVR